MINKINFLLLSIFFVTFSISGIFYFNTYIFGVRNLLFIIAIIFIIINSLCLFNSNRSDNDLQDKILGLFIIVSIIVSMINPKVDFFNKDIVSLCGYVLLFYFTKKIHLTIDQVKIMVLSGVSFAGFIGCLSLYDYIALYLRNDLNLYDISFFNFHASFAGDSSFPIMTGIYDSRTKFNNFLLIYIFLALFLLFNFHFNKKLKFSLILTLLLFVISIFLTLSVGAFLTLVSTLSVFILLHCTNKNIKFSNLYLNIRFNFNSRYILFFLIFIITFCFYHSSIFLDISSKTYVRIDVLIDYFKGDIKQIFLGLKTANIYVEDAGYYGFHSTLGTILGYSGVVGLLCFSSFLFILFYDAIINSKKIFMFWSLSLSVIAWLIFGLAHNLVQCSIIWIIMGLMMNKNFIKSGFIGQNKLLQK